MIIVKHRVNLISDLNKIPKKYGLEVDIRTYNKKLIINHEPFISSLKLDKWLIKYNHNLLIINIKEESIENKVIETLKKFKINNYFLLDSTVPQIINLNKKKFMKIAIRISKYESYINIFNYKNKNKWIWVDTFDGDIPISTQAVKKFKKMGYKICLVSPELPVKDISISSFIKKNKLFIDHIDAICTKKPTIWEKYES